MTTTRACLAALVLLAAPIARLHAQSFIRSIHPALLKAGVDTFVVTLQGDGAGERVAIAIQSQMRVMRAGRPAWEQAYRWLGDDGSRTSDTLWFDEQTLAPMEERSHDASADMVTLFTGSHAVSRRTPRGGREQVSDAGSRRRLYAATELEALIRAAPLRSGYELDYLLYYGPPGRPIRPASFRVARSETITTRRGQVMDCWVVEASEGDATSTYFVSKGDGRVARLVNRGDPDAVYVFNR